MTAAKAKTKKSKRKHSFTLTVCFIAALIAFSILLISINRQIGESRAQLAQVQAQRDSLAAENAQLQNEVDSGSQDDYIERIAREKYGYIKPGDRVYQDVAPGE